MAHQFQANSRSLHRQAATGLPEYNAQSTYWQSGTGSAPPTFGQWIGEALSAEEHRQLYIPPGFAHGFCVTAETAVILYKFTEVYRREAELGVAWNDPDLAIPWPVSTPILSVKDSTFPRLRDIPANRLPGVV